MDETQATKSFDWADYKENEQSPSFRYFSAFAGFRRARQFIFGNLIFVIKATLLIGLISIMLATFSEASNYTDFAFLKRFKGFTLPELVANFTKWSKGIDWPIITIGLVIYVPLKLAIDAMIVRKILGQPTSGTLGLSLGLKELRLACAMILQNLPGLVFILIFALVFLFQPPLPITLFVFIVGFILYLWSNLRVSLFAISAIASEDFNIVKEWKVTENNVWGLLGTNILLTILAILFGLIITFPLIAIFSMGFQEFGARLDQGFTIYNLFAHPSDIVLTISWMFYYGITSIFYSATFVSVYQQIKGEAIN